MGSDWTKICESRRSSQTWDELHRPRRPIFLRAECKRPKTVVKPRGFVIVLVASSGKCGDATVWVTPLNFRHVHVQNVRHHLTKTFSCRKTFVAMVAIPRQGSQLLRFSEFSSVFGGSAEFPPICHRKTEGFVILFFVM